MEKSWNGLVLPLELASSNIVHKYAEASLVIRFFVNPITLDI